MSARTLTGLGAALLVGIGASLATAAGIDNYSNVTDSRLANQEHNNWLQVRGNDEGWLHSKLNEINSGNVGNLRPVGPLLLELTRDIKLLRRSMTE